MLDLNMNVNENRNKMSVYLSIYGSTALCWALAAFLVSVGLLGLGISPSQGPTYTQNNTNTE
jgi:hypothetical protein